VQSLPPFWRTVSHFNPFFYMIDGFRYGFFAKFDVNPWLSLGVLALAFVVTALIAVNLLARGFKLRN